MQSWPLACPPPWDSGERQNENLKRGVSHRSQQANEFVLANSRPHLIKTSLDSPEMLFHCCSLNVIADIN